MPRRLLVAPQLALLQNNVLTVQPLEVFARDGFGLADPKGNRRFGTFDVAKTPLIVPPSGRIEFVVHAPPVGTTLYLQSGQVFPGCGGNQYPPRRLIRITSEGTPVDPGPADDQRSAGRVQPAGQLSDQPVPEADRAPHAGVRRIRARFHLRRDRNGSTGRRRPRTTIPNLTDFYLIQVAADDGEVHRHHDRDDPVQRAQPRRRKWSCICTGSRA